MAEDYELEDARSLSLVILEIATHQIALEKILRDAGIADPSKLAESLAWAKKEMEPLRIVVETLDRGGIVMLLQRLSKTH